LGGTLCALPAMRSLRSDNNAGLCPEALQAIIDANDASHHVGYGDDPHTSDAVAAFRAIFGRETSVWFVATGTAANTLAIASLTQPWQQVICHVHSHYNDDESTAPERITHCRTVQVRTESSKITPDDIHRAASSSRGDVHQPQPGVVTVSNTTEFGTVYTPQEMKALYETAHSLGYRVHVDGARFVNAVASLQCDPKSLTVDAGVDALSFGGTKNGLAFGEAVMFFKQGDGGDFEQAVRTFPFHRKGTGHLLSKHRFVSAPFEATLKGGAWLRHAAHGNAMAARLTDGLRAIGLEPAFPVEANAVFLALPPHVDEKLRAAGHGYYHVGPSDGRLARLMCSFDTTHEDIDRFLADAQAACGSA
jgi:threonine aldolase